MNALMPNMMAESTTVQDAADSLKYYPVWQQEYANGTTDLQFRDWLQQFKGGTTQGMQRGGMMPMNALRGYA